MKKKLLFYTASLFICFLGYSQNKGIKFLNADSLSASKWYSHAVVMPDSKTIKTSGIIGVDETGKLITESPRLQIRQVFKNIKLILQTAGADVKDIFEIETSLTDSVYLKDYAVERSIFFNKKSEPPVSKTYYVKGLINPLAIVEVSVGALIHSNNDTAAYLCVTAVLTSKKGKAEELQTELTKIAAKTLKENGCLAYEVYRSTENGNIFTLHEKWTSYNAFNNHFQMPYMKDLVRKKDELLEKTEIIKTKQITGL